MSVTVVIQDIFLEKKTARKAEKISSRTLDTSRKCRLTIDTACIGNVQYMSRGPKADAGGTWPGKKMFLTCGLSSLSVPLKKAQCMQRGIVYRIQKQVSSVDFFPNWG